LCGVGVRSGGRLDVHPALRVINLTLGGVRMKYFLALLCLAFAGVVTAQDFVDERELHWTGVDPWTRDACLFITGWSDQLPHPRHLDPSSALPGEGNNEYPLYGPWDEQQFQRCFTIVHMLRKALYRQPNEEQASSTEEQASSLRERVMSETVMSLRTKNSQ